ncbi:coproporphyrinogen III oxidase family protein [Fusobacterium animalis]|uniref:coproporphyrinogen-III oxidase family protein n=1 Tax=Fusobacterium animalis TaxID=76859 RepID=UPI0030D06B1A
MFKIRYKSHHDVGNIISKFTENLKASKNDFLDLLNTENKNKQLGIYFHTPYCDKICSFCNMNRKQLDNDLEEYTKYLCEEIKKYGAYEFCKTSEIDVVFFGGGTPTIFKKEQLERILKTLNENFKFAKDYEMTFETTLHNLSFEKLKVMEENGVNRISVGIQTFSNRGRKLLNRTYDKDYVVERLKEIKKRFSGLVCIDIIYNYANQTNEEVLQDANLLAEVGADSASFYSLMIHDGSNISKEREKDKSVYIYDLERDEELHNLFYSRCIEKGYKLLELTKITNGRDSYKYIRNNNGLKNLLPIGVGAGGHIQKIGAYNMNQQMSFYSKTTETNYNLSMIAGLMQFDKFDLDEIKKYCNEESYKIVYRKLKEFEKEGYIKIENNFAIYQLKGIFWGNSLVADIIEKIGRSL